MMHDINGDWETLALAHEKTTLVIDRKHIRVNSNLGVRNQHWS